MKSKNATIKNLPYIPTAPITQNLFGGRGTGLPPAAPLGQVPAWHHHPKIDQNPKR